MGFTMQHNKVVTTRGGHSTTSGFPALNSFSCSALSLFPLTYCVKRFPQTSATAQRVTKSIYQQRYFYFRRNPIAS